VLVFHGRYYFYSLKFTLMFINERKRNANTYLISNFDSLEAALQIYRPRQLPSLPRPKFAPALNSCWAQNCEKKKLDVCNESVFACLSVCLSACLSVAAITHQEVQTGS